MINTMVGPSHSSYLKRTSSTSSGNRLFQEKSENTSPNCAPTDSSGSLKDTLTPALRKTPTKPQLKIRGRGGCPHVPNGPNASGSLLKVEPRDPASHARQRNV